MFSFTQSFNPFTFKVIIDMNGPITIFLIVLGLFCVGLFLLLCLLLREDPLAFVVKLVRWRTPFSKRVFSGTVSYVVLRMPSLSLSFFYLINFYWSLVALQCCVSFDCTEKWIIYPLPFGFPSHSGRHSILSRVLSAIQYVLISYLFYTQYQ